MKSIFEKNAREEIKDRIRSLSAGSTPRWGQMSVGQMIRHGVRCEEYYQGKIVVKRSLLGRLLGPKVLKAMLEDEQPGLRKNAPTPAPFKVTEPVTDVAAEKEQWIALINAYAVYNGEGIIHWFFGPMNRDQLGQFIYRHCDHHLRQFNC